MLEFKTALYAKWLQKRLADVSYMVKNTCYTDATAECEENETKITDVSIVCLEKIFGYLKLDDLLNVADACKYLRTPAEHVFAQRYAQKRVQLHGMQPFKYRKMSISSTIFIRDVRSSLQILRCFGHLISRLEISDEYSNTLYDFAYEFVFRYVDVYCNASLEQIKLWMLPSNKAFERFKAPFLRIKSVEINCCELTKKVTPLNQLFPNVQRLIINFSKFDDFTIIEKRFHRLKHLELSTSIPNIAAVLQLNPQLVKLATKSICDVDILRKISDQLKCLESLDIVCDSDELKYFNGQAFYFENVKKFYLNFSHSRWTLPRLPFEFGELKEFTMLTNHKLNDEFRNFINENPSIVTVNLPLVESSSK